MSGLSVVYEGQNYVVPESEPPQDRDLSKLYPAFRTLLEAYVVFANARYPTSLHIGETVRSEARQVYLYASGRVLPGPARTYTLSSRHRYGLAADLYMVDADGRAVWDPVFWDELYEAAPPEVFGLKRLNFEKVHLELAAADLVINRGEVSLA